MIVSIGPKSVHSDSLILHHTDITLFNIVPKGDTNKVLLRQRNWVKF
jgi:hypothetical protein